MSQTTRHDPIPPTRRITRCVDCGHPKDELHQTPFGPMCRTCAQILAAERLLEKSE